MGLPFFGFNGRVGRLRHSGIDKLENVESDKPYLDPIRFLNWLEFIVSGNDDDELEGHIKYLLLGKETIFLDCAGVHREHSLSNAGLVYLLRYVNGSPVFAYNVSKGLNDTWEIHIKRIVADKVKSYPTLQDAIVAYDSLRGANQKKH